MRERGREKRQGKGRLALEHSAMSPDQPFPTGRVCMGMGEGLFLVCTSLFALGRMHPSVSHIHPRCTHGVLGLLACCLFIRLSLFFLCVCVYSCLADGRTDVLYHYLRYQLLVLVYYPTALCHQLLLLLFLNIK